ncbi:MAG: DUF6431 domain-containing protein [Steroidobacteraceae bacterium]
MAIVLPLSVSVEAYAAAGRDVEVEVPGCPDCASSMGRWSGYWRFVREAATCFKVFVARARCRSCGRAHALLPPFCVLNRLDAADVIGAVIEAVAGGRSGVRPAALRADVPHTTARGWVRAFATNARRLRTAFGALAVELGGEAARVGADQRGGALLAVRASWQAAMSLPGWVALGLWCFTSAVCGGSFLAPNTNSPYLVVGSRRFMPPVP